MEKLRKLKLMFTMAIAITASAAVRGRNRENQWKKWNTYENFYTSKCTGWHFNFRPINLEWFFIFFEHAFHERIHG
jgi:hypothetical protein